MCIHLIYLTFKLSHTFDKHKRIHHKTNTRDTILFFKSEKTNLGLDIGLLYIPFIIIIILMYLMCLVSMRSNHLV